MAARTAGIDMNAEITSLLTYVWLLQRRIPLFFVALITFPARRCAIALYLLSLCGLSLHPSQASIVSKLLNIVSQKQRHTIAHGL